MAQTELAFTPKFLAGMFGTSAHAPYGTAATLGPKRPLGSIVTTLAAELLPTEPQAQ